MQQGQTLHWSVAILEDKILLGIWRKGETDRVILKEIKIRLKDNNDKKEIMFQFWID